MYVRTQKKARYTVDKSNEIHLRKYQWVRESCKTFVKELEIGHFSIIW